MRIRAKRMDGNMQKQKKRLIIIAVVVVFALLAGGRIVSQRNKAKSKADLPIAVRVETPTRGEAFEEISLSGTVAAREEANAYSKAPGKLVKYDKVEGDKVRKDDVIAWVERDEIGLTYSLSPVKAPLTGVLAQRFLDLGATVTPAAGGPGTPVALVINPDQLDVKVNVIEKDLGRVQVGQEARVKVVAYPGAAFAGRVLRVSPVVDSQSRTAQVVIALESGAGRLRHGMFADVSLIVGRRPNALLLPNEALLKQNQRYYVFVANGGQARRREVVCGWPQGDRMEIVSGVQEQDRVVVEGQTRLIEGARIQAVSGE